MRSRVKLWPMLFRHSRAPVFGLAVVCVLALGCTPPSLEECVDRVDPQLRALGLMPEPLVDLSLAVDPNLRVMTINVGNGEDETRYALRLTHQAYEDHIASRIQALAPQIIGLQEVLPRHTCLEDGEAWETNPGRTCFEADQREDQVRRLVGPDYSIVCDDVASVDCLAVHVDFASIEELAPGAYDPEWRGTSPLPSGFRRCDFTGDGCREKAATCDSESSVLGARLLTVAGPIIEVAHLHPTAFGQACREHQLADAFRIVREAKERDPEHLLMMLGDWNVDPDRLNRPTEEVLYYSHVGPGQLLREHDERDEDCARVPTGPYDLGTLDRVATDFARGFCEVQHGSHVPLGADEPRGRIDAGFDMWGVFEDGKDDDRRLDHSAVVCDLYWAALD